MARTKVVTVNGIDYTLQSVTYTWYTKQTDLYLHPLNGNRNTAKYSDNLIKACVTAPAEVAKRGIKYFEDQDDIASPHELVKEIESFLVERKEPGQSQETGET